jgi:enoyl-CoA hydratase/carnithine racemase
MDPGRQSELRKAVVIERIGPIAVLAFHNRPDGTMDEATEQSLHDVLEEVETDPAVRAVVLTGAERDVFIRHYDVGDLAQRGHALSGRHLDFSVDRPVRETLLHRCLRRMETSPKPYLAALNGTTMGGGFEIALACDFRIAQGGSYRIGLPEINLGLLPGAGGTQRLVRLVGTARALDIVMFGRTFEPEEAVGLGLVNECADDARVRALALAEILCGKPALALAHAKRLIRQFGGGSLEQGLAAERTLFCDLLMRPESLTRMDRMLAGSNDILTIGE